MEGESHGFVLVHEVDLLLAQLPRPWRPTADHEADFSELRDMCECDGEGEPCTACIIVEGMPLLLGSGEPPAPAHRFGTCQWYDDTDGECTDPAMYTTPWCKYLCTGHATLVMADDGDGTLLYLPDSSPLWERNAP